MFCSTELAYKIKLPMKSLAPFKHKRFMALAIIRNNMVILNPLTLRVPRDGIVCFSHTFENNLVIK